MAGVRAVVGDRVWSPAEIDEAIGEDEDWRRYEIVDGVLVVSPHAGLRHQIVSQRIITMLSEAAEAAGSAFEVVGPLGVDLGRSYRVTDVTVVRRSAVARDPSLVLPADVLLVAEVESPTSVTTDRITKPAQYAAAGIDHYWRVELDPIRLVTYRRNGEVYEQTGSWGAGEVAHIASPFAVDVEVGSLLP